MSNYAESIERFAKVNEAAIAGIVKHLGIALQSADGSTVAASDPDELKTIQEGFCAKHLGMTAEAAAKAVEEVCETMKHDAAKCRVTFYYLLADKVGKLADFE